MFCTQYIKHDRLVDLILIPAKQSFDLHLLALYLTVTRCICTVYMITTPSVLRLTHGAPQAIRFKVNKYSQPDFLTFLFNSFYLMATIVDMSKGNCLFVIRSEFASLCLGKKIAQQKRESIATGKYSWLFLSAIQLQKFIGWELFFDKQIFVAGCEVDPVHVAYLLVTSQYPVSHGNIIHACGACVLRARWARDSCISSWGENNQ